MCSWICPKIHASFLFFRSLLYTPLHMFSIYSTAQQNDFINLLPFGIFYRDLEIHMFEKLKSVTFKMGRKSKIEEGVVPTCTIFKKLKENYRSINIQVVHG